MFPEINRVSLTVGTDVWSCCGKGRPIRDLPFWNVLAYTVFQLEREHSGALFLSEQREGSSGGICVKWVWSRCGFCHLVLQTESAFAAE